jgi:hypothetical protein
MFVMMLRVFIITVPFFVLMFVVVMVTGLFTIMDFRLVELFECQHRVAIFICIHRDVSECCSSVGFVGDGYFAEPNQFFFIELLVVVSVQEIEDESSRLLGHFEEILMLVLLLELGVFRVNLLLHFLELIVE